MAMKKATCPECGTFCWHNPCGKKERMNGHPNGRCTFCGHPVDNGDANSSKRAGNRDIHNRQVTRARLLRG